MCETSNWCILKARRLLKEVKNGCMLSGASGDDGAVVLPKITDIVVDFNKNTTNFGYGLWIPSQAGAEEVTVDGAGGDGAGADGDDGKDDGSGLPLPPLTDDQLKSARNIKVKDKWGMHEPDAGLWKGTVYYTILDELNQPLIEPTQQVYFVIDDTQTYIKANPEATETIEEFKTSFMLWPCTDMKEPCLANTILSAIEKDDNYADVKDAWKGKMADWIKSISTRVGYEQTDCVSFRTFKSKLSVFKKERADTEINHVICPFAIHQTKRLQRAIETAFNRSMFLISPVDSLPLSEENVELEADVLKGSKFMSGQKIKFFPKS